VVSLAATGVWPPSFPFGTLIVNVAGCAGIGFTTFSAFGLGTVSLFERNGRLALANVVLRWFWDLAPCLPAVPSVTSCWARPAGDPGADGPFAC